MYKDFYPGFLYTNILRSQNCYLFAVLAGSGALRPGTLQCREQGATGAHVLPALWGRAAQLHRDADRPAADKAGPRLLSAPPPRRDLRPHRGADPVRRQVRAAGQRTTHLPQGRPLIAADPCAHPPIRYQQHYFMGFLGREQGPHRHLFVNTSACLK